MKADLTQNFSHHFHLGFLATFILKHAFILRLLTGPSCREFADMSIVPCDSDVCVEMIDSEAILQFASCRFRWLFPSLHDLIQLLTVESGRLRKAVKVRCCYR